MIKRTTKIYSTTEVLLLQCYRVLFHRLLVWHATCRIHYIIHVNCIACYVICSIHVHRMFHDIKQSRVLLHDFTQSRVLHGYHAPQRSVCLVSKDEQDGGQSNQDGGQCWNDVVCSNKLSMLPVVVKLISKRLKHYYAQIVVLLQVKTK